MTTDADSSAMRSGTSADWTSASIAELIDHIVSVHHSYTRRLIGQAAALVRQMTIFPSPPVARAFAVEFTRFEKDVLAHLELEENILFPACLALDLASHPGGTRGEDYDVSRAIHIMAVGHDATRQDIVRLLDQARGLPDGNKPRTIAALRQILGELDADLIEHGTLEEGILLPAVMFLQELSKTRHATRDARPPAPAGH